MVNNKKMNITEQIFVKKTIVPTNIPAKEYKVPTRQRTVYIGELQTMAQRWIKVGRSHWTLNMFLSFACKAGLELLY